MAQTEGDKQGAKGLYGTLYRLHFMPCDSKKNTTILMCVENK